MKTKSMIFGVAAIASSMLMAADTPEVENVVMSQAQFGRMVTVTYKLKNAPAVVTFDVETNTLADASGKWVSIGGEAVCNAKGAVWRKVTEADADSEGKYTITWRPDLSWEGHKVSLADGGARAVVTAWALDNTPDYMVVDISAGAQPNTQKYYTSTNFLPGGLFGNPDYRTSKLVMRKIMAKDVEWTRGSLMEANRTAANEGTHSVKLDSNYYIGVFEITQSQWASVVTDEERRLPSNFNNPAYSAMRPVENVSYNEIRHSTDKRVDDDSFCYPAEPNEESFLGLLNKKTGIKFDLPTESQWEYAARAGNGDTKWGDGSDVNAGNGYRNDNMNRLGRYQFNGGKVNDSETPSQDCGPENGTAVVGTYHPNSLGLYDMHGNVWEWCLDWFQFDVTKYNGKVNVNTSAPTSPIEGTVEGGRSVRSGAWSRQASLCRSAFRHRYAATSQSSEIGFRVVCTAGLQ